MAWTWMVWSWYKHSTIGIEVLTRVCFNWQGFGIQVLKHSQLVTTYNYPVASGGNQITLAETQSSLWLHHSCSYNNWTVLICIWMGQCNLLHDTYTLNLYMSCAHNWTRLIFGMQLVLSSRHLAYACLQWLTDTHCTIGMAVYIQI